MLITLQCKKEGDLWRYTMMSGGRAAGENIKFRDHSRICAADIKKLQDKAIPELKSLVNKIVKDHFPDAYNNSWVWDSDEATPQLEDIAPVERSVTFYVGLDEVDVSTGTSIDMTTYAQQVSGLFAAIQSLNEQIIPCEHCSNIGWRDSMVQVIEGNRRRMWCTDCSRSAFQWRDGTFHTEEQAGNIPSYHSTNVTIPSSVLVRSDVLGVELETYQGQINDASKFLSQLRKSTNQAIKYERDGSLDHTYGVEIVAVPETLENIRKEGSIWHQIIMWSKSNGGKSWNMGEGYGMHISINGGALNPLHRCRFLRFFNDNKYFVTRLAGRKESSYALFKPPKLSDGHKQTEKFMAATNRDRRVEVRVFRGTLVWKRFIRNCELVDSVRVYTRDCGCSEQALGAPAFIVWLARPDNRKAYPFLCEELQIMEKKEKKPQEKNDSKKGVK